MRISSHLKHIIVIFLAMIFANVAQAENRVALVIGNSAYETIGALNNAGHDARLIADRLKSLNFKVFEHYDLTEDGMADAIDAFAIEAASADVGALYYAGHGMQKDGENYLMPIDTELKSPASIERDGIPLRSILNIMENLPTGLVFLDACRNNPFAEAILAKAKTSQRSAGLSRGLAFVRPLGDTLVAFATLPNATASDGNDGNSPFAKSLAKHMTTPDIEVSVMMKRVTRDVMEETNRQQRPQQLSQMQNEFYFSQSNKNDSDEKVVVAVQQPNPLLAVYPPYVTVGEEVSVVADVPKSCKPFFLNIGPGGKLTPIPLQFFKQVELGYSQFRYEISPGSRYGLVVQEQDEKGKNNFGYFCEPEGTFEKPQIQAALRQIITEIKNGHIEGEFTFENLTSSFQFRDFTIQ
ncbi:MAG: caspase domain-containing protein [Lentilitoribacter sp.]